MLLDLQALKFMWNGGETRRYHGFRMLMEDTVGQHSYNVACIIMAVRPNASATLLRAALKHDMAEHITGDMPAPTKRAIPGLKEAFGLHEAQVAAQHRVDLEEEGLTEDERRILKIADALDGMRFCVIERALGNRRISLVFTNFSDYALDLLGKDLGERSAERELYHALWADWRKYNG